MILISLVAGVIFALGLALGGMTHPEKVMGFLDFFGAWDPSLAFVMGGAVGVHTLAYVVQRKMKKPLMDVTFLIPHRRDVDKRLVLGTALFGIGWGLSGYCPGPAIVSLSGGLSAVVFVLCMIIGGAVGMRIRPPHSQSELSIAPDAGDRTNEHST